ncbi:MAG: DNA-processing protein DprA [Acutalibacteraceae bacterium]|nr:DNA-processing protein DprA [Acutalibacteraceae bacterium]
MNDTLKYWVWLQACLGYANPKVNVIRRFYPSIIDFYNGGKQEWLLCGCFTKSEMQNLSTFTLEQAQQIIDKCNMLGYKMYTMDMPQYPAQLKEIYDPPAVLYVNGNLPDVDNILSIAMVGTRNSTVNGKRLAYSIAYDLAKSGVVVVSGGALGIDTSSHTGALSAQGTTICVLGCGINYNYLMGNAQMRSSIAKTGAVISEYPPDTAPQKYSFPKRNRIISALSQGVLVVEAGEKSGALITASTALSQNKDVFAIPGDVTNAVAFGTNSLIKQGAKPVTNAMDIIEEYTNKYSLTIEEPLPIDEISDNIINSIPNGKKRAVSVNSIVDKNNNTTSVKNTDNVDINNKVSKKLLSDISDNASLIYDIVFEAPSTVDDIIIKTKLTASAVMQALTELELEEAVTRKSGGAYHPI